MFATFSSCNERGQATHGEIAVAEHYNGADATVLQITDQYFMPYSYYVRDDNRKYSAAWAEFLAFKYNVPLHVFEQNVKGSMFKAFLQSGRGGASVYYPTCHDTYRKSKLDSIIAEIGDAYGRTPTTISYGCNVVSYADSLPNYILGGRTSEYVHLKSGAEAITWYGKDMGNLYDQDFSELSQLLKRSAGGRYYTDIQRDDISVENSAKYVKEQVQQSVRTHGFYTNFMHWHDQYKNTDGAVIEGVAVMEQLFDAMHKGLKGARNSYLDYNEAVEYLYAKEAVDAISVREESADRMIIDLIHSKKRDRDYSVIATPISVKIPKHKLHNFDMTTVAKQERVVSIFEDENNYYVNISLDFEQKKTEITLNRGQSSYEILNLDRKLKIVKAFFSDQITANMPCKYVLFKRKKGANSFEVELMDRRYNFSEKYELPDLEEGYDYFCGAITRTRESAIIQLEP
ncbi:MAG: hypothetical protein R3359_00125 [Marinirhabdus sp.]|nr:hypothetical protein [Marinirhabdus sp.]